VHIADMFDSDTWQDHDELVHCVADNIDTLLAQVELVLMLILIVLRVCIQPAASTELTCHLPMLQSPSSPR